MLARERLKRLWKVALTAPSHERVVLIHRYNSNAHPILCNGPLPDPPAGRILPSELGGPRAESEGQSTPTLSVWGGSGAGLTIARLGNGSSWSCTPSTRGGAKSRHPLARPSKVPVKLLASLAFGSARISISGFQRSVEANTPLSLSDRPRHTRLTHDMELAAAVPNETRR